MPALLSPLNEVLVTRPGSFRAIPPGLLVSKSVSILCRVCTSTCQSQIPTKQDPPRFDRRRPRRESRNLPLPSTAVAYFLYRYIHPPSLRMARFILFHLRRFGCLPLCGRAAGCARPSWAVAQQGPCVSSVLLPFFYAVFFFLYIGIGAPACVLEGPQKGVEFLDFRSPIIAPLRPPSPPLLPRHPDGGQSDAAIGGASFGNHERRFAREVRKGGTSSDDGRMLRDRSTSKLAVCVHRFGVFVRFLREGGGVDSHGHTCVCMCVCWFPRDSIPS